MRTGQIPGPATARSRMPDRRKIRRRDRITQRLWAFVALLRLRRGGSSR